LPAEVPPLVVRLESRTAQVLEPDRGLSRPYGRPLPIHRRAADRRTRLPLPGREGGTESLAAAREVAARYPPLHPARLPLDRRRGLGGDRLVRDPLHRALPARPLRLRPRRLPLDQPSRRLRIHPRHRRVPAVPIQPITPKATGLRPPGASRAGG